MSQDDTEIIVPLADINAEISKAVAGMLDTLHALPYGKPTPAAITLPRPVALLLADLLDRASDSFSVNSCNDYTFLAEAEPARESILRAYAAWNCSPDVPADPGDWSLMALGAAILRDPGLLVAK